MTPALRPRARSFAAYLRSRPTFYTSPRLRLAALRHCVALNALLRRATGHRALSVALGAPVGVA